MEYVKKDWELFKTKVVEWQEKYMGKLNNEYIELLRGDGISSEKFWKLEKRIKKDKQSCGVQIELNKQNMPYDIVAFINEGIITFADIEEFSDDLKGIVQFILER